VRVDEKDLERMIQWESLLATLFGKFYEPIVAGYFKMRGYEVYCRNISVDVRSLESVEEVRERLKRLYENGGFLVGLDLERIRERIEDSIRRYREDKRRKRFNPDLVVERGGRYYIVEMQIWPVWLKQRFGSFKFTWRVILEENTALLPRVFATRVKVNGRERGVAGFYYVTFDRSNDHDTIREFFEKITRREFELFYITEILREVKSQEWYRRLIDRVEEKVLEFFGSLREGKMSFK